MVGQRKVDDLKVGDKLCVFSRRRLQPKRVRVQQIYTSPSQITLKLQGEGRLSIDRGTIVVAEISNGQR